MADFSVISQDPVIRQLVQENLLERAFHDALFPRLLFRMEAVPQQFPGNLGDTIIFTGAGLIKPKTKPLYPGMDPSPSTYASEQWNATVQQYADSIDTHMPTAAVAIADLFLRNAHQLGMAAGQSLNRVVRDRLYTAGVSGNTFAEATAGSASGSQTLSGSSGTLRVRSLAGFTTARNPGGTTSPVRFSRVGTSNSLDITVVHTGGTLSAKVVDFAADINGDEIGPGVLSLTYSPLGGSITVNAKSAVLSFDATKVIRTTAAGVEAGKTTWDLTAASSVFQMPQIRAAIARLRQQNVAETPDGFYHCHLDPTSESAVFNDPAFQRLLTSMPDYYMYSQFALGKLLGTVFFRNNECPLSQTVDEGDPLNLVLATDEGIVHRPIFVGAGAINEYFIDMNMLLTEAGVTGKVGEFQITNNGISVASERIKLVIRSPLDRLQQMVSTSYAFIGDWPVRTDAATGDAARYKREVVVEHIS